MATFYDRSNAAGGGAYYDRGNSVQSGVITAALPEITASINAIPLQNIVGAAIDNSDRSFFYNLDFIPVDGDIIAIPRYWGSSVITVAASGIFNIAPPLPNGTHFPRLSLDVSTGIWYEDTVTVNAGTNTILVLLPELTGSVSGTVEAPSSPVVSGSVAATLPGVTGLISATSNELTTANVSAMLTEVTAALSVYVGDGEFGIPTNREFLFASVSQYLVTGDVFKELGTAYAGDPRAPYSLAAATAIKACVVAYDHSAKLCDQVTLSSDDEGAHWENGVIAVVIPKTITAQIAAYAARETVAKLEIQATLNGDDFTWYETILLRQGFVA